MADTKLVGQNYTTPDLLAKVTGRSKYAEDFRAEGMLFAKLLLSPLPHARVRSVDTSEALAMPGVVDIIVADEFGAALDVDHKHLPLRTIGRLADWQIGRLRNAPILD